MQYGFKLDQQRVKSMWILSSAWGKIKHAIWLTGFRSIVFMCTYIREYLWTRLVCCLISEYKKQEVGDRVNCEAVDRCQKRLFNTHFFNVCGDCCCS